ncbi:unnamed protein product [Ixodes hexagonus]
MHPLPTFSAFIHNIANVFWSGCSPSNTLRIPKDWLVAFGVTPDDPILVLGDDGQRRPATGGVLPKSSYLRAEEARGSARQPQGPVVVVDGIQYDAKEKHYVRLQRMYGELSETTPSLPPSGGFAILTDPSTGASVISRLNTVDRMLWALVVRNAIAFHHHGAPTKYTHGDASYSNNDTKRQAIGRMVDQAYGTITNLDELFNVDEALGGCLLGSNFAKLFDRHFCSGDATHPSAYGGVKTWVAAAMMYLYSPSLPHTVVNRATKLTAFVERGCFLNRPKSDMYGIGVDLCVALDDFRRNYASDFGNGAVLASRFGTPCVDYLYAFQTLVYRLLFRDGERINPQLWWSHHYEVDVTDETTLPLDAVDQTYRECVNDRKLTLAASAVTDAERLNALNVEFINESRRHLRAIMTKVFLPTFSRWFCSSFFDLEQRTVKNVHDFVASMAPDRHLLYGGDAVSFATQYPNRPASFNAPNGGAFDASTWLAGDNLFVDYVRDYTKEDLGKQLKFVLFDLRTGKPVPNVRDVFYENGSVNVSKIASIIKQERNANYGIYFPVDISQTAFPYEVFFGEGAVRDVTATTKAFRLTPVETCAFLHATTCVAVSENIVTAYY